MKKRKLVALVAMTTLFCASAAMAAKPDEAKQEAPRPAFVKPLPMEFQHHGGHCPHDRMFRHQFHTPLSPEQHAVFLEVLNEQRPKLDAINDQLFVNKQLLAVYVKNGMEAQVKDMAQQIIELRKERRAIMQGVYKATAEKLKLPQLENEGKAQID